MNSPDIYGVSRVVCHIPQCTLTSRAQYTETAPGRLLFGELSKEREETKQPDYIVKDQSEPGKYWFLIRRAHMAPTQNACLLGYGSLKSEQRLYFA